MLTVLTALNLIALLLLLAWPVVRFGSIFLFDAPGSERYVTLWGLTGALWVVWPFAPLAGNLLFWALRPSAPLSTLALATGLSYAAVLLTVVFALLFGVERRLRGRRA